MNQALNLQASPFYVPKNAYLPKKDLFAIGGSIILHAGLFLWLFWNPAGPDLLSSKGRAPITVSIIMPVEEQVFAPEKLSTETHSRNIEQESSPMTEEKVEVIETLIAEKSKTKISPVVADYPNRELIKQLEPLENKPKEHAVPKLGPAPATDPNSQKSQAYERSDFPVVSTSKGEADYFDTIRAWLGKHKTYPRRARLKGMEGEVIISFTYNRDGQILSNQMIKSSGYDILDRAALNALYAANPLPAIPDSLNKNQMTLSVPFGFNLM